MSPSSTNTNTRWCPTPEQLMILEELYRRGLKTPNATQIQRITGHLSMYGKIQGKNVFYWFQNHKARDRQKLRKRLAKQLHHLLLPQPQFHYFPHQFPPNFLHEGTSNGGVCDEVMSWTRADLVPNDCFIGHQDYAMSSNTNTKPIQTLELFPLHSTKDDENENPTP